MSVELIVTGVALASACILLAHAIDAYRTHQRARDRREHGTEAPRDGCQRAALI